MPYKSKAQQRAMHAKADRGEIDKSVVEEFDEATKKQKGGFKALPERKKKKKEKKAMDKVAMYAELLKEAVCKKQGKGKKGKKMSGTRPKHGKAVKRALMLRAGSRAMSRLISMTKSAQPVGGATGAVANEHQDPALMKKLRDKYYNKTKEKNPKKPQGPVAGAMSKGLVQGALGG